MLRACRAQVAFVKFLCKVVPIANAVCELILNREQEDQAQ